MVVREQRTHTECRESKPSFPQMWGIASGAAEAISVTYKLVGVSEGFDQCEKRGVKLLGRGAEIDERANFLLSGLIQRAEYEVPLANLRKKWQCTEFEGLKAVLLTSWQGQPLAPLLLADSVYPTKHQTCVLSLTLCFFFVPDLEPPHSDYF